MVYHALITLVLLVSISGCASARHQGNANMHKPMLMTDVYAQSVGDAQKDVANFIGQNLIEQKTYGYVSPYIPVIEPPVVRKIWVPDHKSEENEEVLVGGHWVYLMVQGPKWFIDEQTKDTRIPVIVPGKPIEQEKRSYDAGNKTY